ncbi:glycosyltransferase [Methylobacterium mesophilicum]
MVNTGGFDINGRFLSQQTTGVQRYAINVSRSIGTLNEAAGRSVNILSPPCASDQKFDGLNLKTVGRLKGHSWEQLDLPRFTSEFLLNFCNTAPVFKSRQIVCIHDANVFTAKDSYSLPFVALYRAMQPMLARKSARIATVSQFSAGELSKRLSLKLPDIAILPNGHEHVFGWDETRATHKVRTQVARFKLDGRPFVLALGSRARHKNLAMLIDLAPALEESGISLVIAGGGGNIFTTEILEKHDNIFYLGFVTDDDLAHLFKSALCLAFPSFTEGFGLPVLEAMALGCPCVSTNRASLPEICGTAALFAAPDQPADWLSNIKYLIDNSDFRSELIERGVLQSKKFSWATTAEEYLDLVDPPEGKITKKEDISKAPLVGVIIATLGRPEVTTETLKRIVFGQSLRPSFVIVSCVNIEDAGEVANWPEVRVVTGPPGLTAQRNTALALLPEDIDVVVFFDDDFVPASNWLSVVAEIFSDQKDVVCLTGEVVVDGIKGPGLNFEQADRALTESMIKQVPKIIEPFSPYGCNMAFRRSEIKSLRFDERLVLYGWLEDRDFGSSLRAQGGRLIKYTGARGVHLGVKSGRIAGMRLGYSQVINPIYMMRKGTMAPILVLDHMFRNIASNIIKSLAPERFVDRRGRLRGNLMGLLHVLQGKIEPEAVKKIK